MWIILLPGQFGLIHRHFIDNRTDDNNCLFLEWLLLDRFEFDISWLLIVEDQLFLYLIILSYHLQKSYPFHIFTFSFWTRHRIRNLSTIKMIFYKAWFRYNIKLNSHWLFHPFMVTKFAILHLSKILIGTK